VFGEPDVIPDSCANLSLVSLGAPNNGIAMCIEVSFAQGIEVVRLSCVKSVSLLGAPNRHPFVRHNGDQKY
jgi:hypothetical protein